MVLRRSTISLCQRLGGLSKIFNEKLCCRAQGSFFQRYDVRRSSGRGEFHGQDLELGKPCAEMERRFLNHGEKSRPGAAVAVTRGASHPIARNALATIDVTGCSGSGSVQFSSTRATSSTRDCRAHRLSAAATMTIRSSYSVSETISLLATGSNVSKMIKSRLRSRSSWKSHSGVASTT